jgi:hypothetical protein
MFRTCRSTWGDSSRREIPKSCHGYHHNSLAIIQEKIGLHIHWLACQFHVFDYLLLFVLILLFSSPVIPYPWHGSSSIIGCAMWNNWDIRNKFSWDISETGVYPGFFNGGGGVPDRANEQPNEWRLYPQPIFVKICCYTWSLVVIWRCFIVNYTIINYTMAYNWISEENRYLIFRGGGGGAGLVNPPQNLPLSDARFVLPWFCWCHLHFCQVMVP